MSTIYPKYVLGFRLGLFALVYHSSENSPCVILGLTRLYRGMFSIAGACAGLIAVRGTIFCPTRHIFGSLDI